MHYLQYLNLYADVRCKLAKREMIISTLLNIDHQENEY